MTIEQLEAENNALAIVRAKLVSDLAYYEAWQRDNCNKINEMLGDMENEYKHDCELCMGDCA